MGPQCQDADAAAIVIKPAHGLVSAGRHTGHDGSSRGWSARLAAARAAASCWTIRTRTLAVGLAVTIAIFGAAALIIYMQRLAAIDAFRTGVANLGNGMARQTAQSLTAVAATLQEIETNLGTTPGASRAELRARMRSREMADLLADARARLPGLAAFAVVAADGTTDNASRGWPHLPPVDHAFLAGLRRDAGAMPSVGPPVRSPLTGRWSALMARRIEDSRGDLVGAAVAAIDLGQLEDFYRVAMPAHRCVYLLRRDGVVLLRYPRRDADIGRKIPEQSPWYAAVARGGGGYIAPGHFAEAPVIATVQPLPGLPLVVQAGVLESEALVDWRRETVCVGSASLCGFIGLILLLRLFGRQYRRLELSELSLAAANAQLVTAHRQLDAMLANLFQGVSFYGDDKRLVAFNRRCAELYRLEDALRPGMSLREVAELRRAAGSFPRQSVDDYEAFVDRLVRAGHPYHSADELADGRTLSCQLQPLPGRGWVLTHEDITERRAVETRTAFLARHDALTGLANRLLFLEQIEAAIARAQRGTGFALLCLDLDRFKAVNDTHGHPVGDALLHDVAARLRAVVRDGDTVARLGGDEFAILQHGVADARETAALARRIVAAIGRPFDLNGHQVSIGTSIGITMPTGGAANPARLIEEADMALYRAKQDGGATWRFFEPAMDKLSRARRALETDLRQALPSGQLEVHYQPILRAVGNSVCGFEALLRWRHPTRGLLSAREFISVAEEIGLIADLGAWVLLQACTDAAAWPSDIRVAVNLSARQFRGPALPDAVAAALRKSGLAPDRLDLEITEAVPLRQNKAAMAALHDLRQLGAQIALDDFGAGEASLSYLRSFPFDRLKLHPSSLAEIPSRGPDAGVVRGIVGLAAHLEMSVTAKGVETERQRALITAAGCAEIQGFLVGHPLPARQIPDLLARLSAGSAGGRSVSDLAAD